MDQDDHDKALFLELLAQGHQRFGWVCDAFAGSVQGYPARGGQECTNAQRRYREFAKEGKCSFIHWVPHILVAKADFSYPQLDMGTMLKEFQIVSATWGIKYNFATHFFDNRGVLMEKARHVFKNPEAIEFGFAINDQVPESVELVSPAENLRIRINPKETNLSISKFDTVDNFKALIDRFCRSASDVYAKNQLSLNGVVFRLQGKLSEQGVLDMFPALDHNFAHSFDFVSRCHTTYRENDYRIHVILLVNEKSRTDFTLDFDTQKVQDVVFQESPRIVDECYKRLKRFIDENLERKGK